MIVRKGSLAPIDFGGLAIYDFTLGKQAGSSFALIEIPPQAQHPLAKSNKSDKYYYVIRGSLCFHLDGVDYNLDEGDFCLVKQGHVFSYRNETGELAQLALVHAPPFDMQAEIFFEAGN